MNCEVLVELKSKNLDKTFTYSIPSELIDKVSVGIRVLVPFGKQKLEGFILKITDEQFDYKLKDVIDIIDNEPVLNEELLELGKYISKKTLCNLITSYQAMLPTALKAKKWKVIPKKYNTFLVLNTEDFCGIKSNKQLEILNKIKEEKKVLKKDCIYMSEYSVKVLIEKEYIKEIKEESYRISREKTINDKPKVLNMEQLKVVDEVKNNLNIFQPYLLHGVTGSGKTEVYMHIIDEVIRNGKEALVLVPEISLTPQFVSQFEKRFGSKIAVLHSRLSDGEKYDEWRKIIRGEISIVIGARSAVFAPLTNIGVIIIIDEEHTSTYKQENNPHYSAIDIGIYRAKKYNVPIILGSATPSIESYTRAEAGVYKLLEMKNRVNNNLPYVSLVDMKSELKKGNRILCSELIDCLNNCVKNNEQAIILLNRRGFSTILTCRDCGYTVKCSNCDIPLTFHKTSNTMRCHYCGYGSGKISTCPSCKSGEMNYFGMGTEKLSEWIEENIVGSRVIRMDIDTTSNKGAHEKIINSFKNEEYNILVGTQMIAKGLDFPNVTLVGVVSGDASLNIPDFRSAERTFQLLNQVAGRAGRSEKSGKVIIQGFNMNHYSIRYAATHNYLDFYKEEMEIRKNLNYPPYCNLCLIKIVGSDYNLVSTEANKISNYLKNNLKEKSLVLGPSSALTPKINNNYYINIILKYKKTEYILESLNFIKDKYKDNRKINLDIYINPNQI